jgi:hypothetical protein
LAFDFYVWYRVGRDEAAAELAVRTMMARLGCRSGVPGRLLKKRDEPRLWMEVYEGVADADAFERLLAQALDEYDVEMFLDGARCSECFVADALIPGVCAASR